MEIIVTLNAKAQADKAAKYATAAKVAKKVKKAI